MHSVFGSRVSRVPLRVALFAAFRSGSLAGVQLRPRRSGSSGGWVLVAAFRQAPRALRFGAWAAGWLGCSCRVSAVGGLPCVSVGVELPEHCLPLGSTGRWLPARGGLRRIVALAALWGLR